MTTVAGEAQPVAQGASWEFILTGVVAIAVGGFLLVQPGMTAVLVLQALGIFWIVAGCVGVVEALRRRGEFWGWRLIAGVMSVVGGLLVIVQPQVVGVVTVGTLYYCLALVAVVVGVIRIVAGLSRPRSWGGITIGALQLLLAVLLLFHPLTGTLIMVPLIALVTVGFGVVFLIAGFLRPSMISSEPEEIGAA